jgi:RNA polymerase sigma-70 factor (ECF subfamily)
VSEQTRDALVELLATALPEHEIDRARVGEQLAGMVRAAETRWPAIRLDAAQFVAHLVPLVFNEDDVTTALGKLHGDDLYLACACLGGNAAATAIFEAEYLQPLRLPHMHAAASSDLVDEIRQRLREKVLAQGRIRGYSGKGPLGGWLRVAATRLALDLESDARRRQRVESLPEEDVPSLPPEQQLMRDRYREPIEAAFQHAFEGLDDEQRRLLRLHYIDGVSLQDIGTALGVDRSTASRRVAAARDQLLESVRRELGAALQLTPASVDTLVQALKSQLVITLRALR